MGGARRRRMGVGQGPALFQEGRARPRLQQRMARQGRPHPRAAYSGRALDQARCRCRRGLQARRHEVPARPERRVRRRLLPRDPLQRLRAARFRRDGLSRRRDPQTAESHHLDQYAGEVAAVRRHAVRRRQGNDRRQGNRVPRPRSDPVRRRDPFAGTFAARGHRAGRPSPRHGHSGGVGARGRRPAADGPSVDLAVLVHPPRRAHERAHPAAHPHGHPLFVEPSGHSQGRHVRGRGHQIRLARRGRADRFAADLHQPHLLGDRAGQARHHRLAQRADRRVQSPVRQARPRPADDRLPQDGRAADEPAAQGGER